MTVTSQIQDVTYSTDGLTVLFPIPFYFINETDVIVDKIDDNGGVVELAFGTDFTVSGAGDENGGSVSTLVAYAAGFILRIYRSVPVTQETVYQQNDAFPAKTTERALDKLTMICQQLAAGYFNSLRYPRSEYSSNGELPTAPNRISKILGFDATGHHTMLPMPASVGAGDLKSETWTAGVDFTAGTSTSVVLSRAYGTKANLGVVVMAGVPQDPNTYDLGNNGTMLQFNAPIPGGVDRIWCFGGTTLSVYVPPDGSVDDTKVAPGSKLYQRIIGKISVMDPPFNASGMGGDDTVAIATADVVANLAGKQLFFPSGTYGINLSGIQLSGASWVGEGRTRSIIKSLAQTFSPSQPNLVWASGKSGFFIRDIGFDVSAATFPAGTGNPGNVFCMLSPINCNNWQVVDCAFTGIKAHVIGLAVNGGANFDIVRNYFNMPSPTGAEFNQAINISTSAGSVIGYRVVNNTMEGTAFNSGGAQGLISGNRVSNWKFGGGLTFGPNPACIMNVIQGNICTGGQGYDVNNTYPSGIEYWGAYSIIEGNICSNNSGSGITNGNIGNTLRGNICFNNSQTVGANLNGITMYSISGSYQAQNCIVAGNICFDNQTIKTQQYGYAESQQAGVIAYNLIHDNNFSGNAVGTEKFSGAVTSFRGPQITFRGTISPGTVGNSGTATFTYGITGARFGDTVKVGIEQSMQGCVLAGYVGASDSVVITITNLTGGGKIFGTGPINILVEKPAEHSSLV
ncbi:hypothetical protein [Burkholderia stagnalis]|uniref:hypothetical protein n=1 Tax=Burkholderia stagnalis TaxID=1503054 RepID=UPI000F575FEB|nr:hypothetical protein [Burkholderia stagnalis]RQQ30531.1 hypothetical protein DF163_14235 [Burkholderia stagnalis]RQY01131.1 hypothetical protein DF119_09055 [Burkholderia stagnalis]